MAVSGDVTFAQDGGHSNVKLHPYFVALVRWCVSCVWSTATVLLHRLVAGSIPGHTIDGITVPRPKPRAASSEHLSREPKVECQVLHTPATHRADVIFVHGLYGSLGNTWRQGDWRSKYKIEPDKVPLLRPATCKCQIEPNVNNNMNEYENVNEVTYKRVEEKFYDGIKKIIPNDEAFLTENFYTNTLLDQVEIVDNYETQAKFVRDLFESENGVCNNNIQGCDSNYDSLKFECQLEAVNCETNEVDRNLNDTNCNCEANEVARKLNEVNCNCEVEIDSIVNGDLLKVNENNCECKVSEGRKCQVGCGCVCDVCYSSCWPRDWIKEDYPEARVISINYTSDPYLWRPIWIKECKRLRLHERAEQMTKQLLELGVGRKPVIWVGHSKGGLFIKQIYCEAYEAYLKTQNQHRTKTKIDENGQTYETQDLSCRGHEEDNSNLRNLPKDSVLEPSNINIICENHFGDDNGYTRETLELNDNVLSVNHRRKNNNVMDIDNERRFAEIDEAVLSSDNEEDYSARQAALWSNSVGFMFYSVPHRGSPLADIKTPITARSIELLEISKDCALVLSLQARWLRATQRPRPQVRSLVETCRTLMAVLWLRIVSVPSADAGIGALYGVSLDHREICKPSSRRCLLYTELMALMHAALRQCRCDGAEIGGEKNPTSL